MGAQPLRSTLQSERALSITRGDRLCAECSIRSAVLAQHLRPPLNSWDGSLVSGLLQSLAALGCRTGGMKNPVLELSVAGGAPRNS